MAEVLDIRACESSDPSVIEALLKANQSETGHTLQASLMKLEEMAKAVEDAAEESSDDLLKNLKDELEKCSGEDPEEFMKLGAVLAPIIKKSGAKVQGQLQKVLDCLKKAGEGLEAESDAHDNTFRYRSGMIAEAMLFIQQFQTAVSESQADQDQISARMGAVLLQSAQAQQKDVADKIEKAEADRKAGSDKPWWEWLIMAVVMLVSLVVTALTGGAAGIITTLIVTVFTQSPLFNMAVDAIAKAMEPAFENMFKAQGDSDEDAKEKAQGLANIIAKLVMVVVVAVAAAGVTGAMSGFQGVTGTALARAMGVSFGATGFGSLMTSNVWIDFFSFDPQGMKDKTNRTLVEVFDAIMMIIGMVASFAVGMKSGVTGKTPNFAADFMSKFGPALIRLNTIMQMGNATMEAALSIARGVNLEEAAEITEEIAMIQKTLKFTFASLDTFKEAEETTNSSGDGIVEQITRGEDQLLKVAGTDWAMTERVLAS